MLGYYPEPTAIGEISVWIKMRMNIQTMRSLFLTGLSVVALFLGAGTAAAQEAGEGLRLSRQWCTSCHIVEPGASGSDAARPFEAIANDIGFTQQVLRAWLADPHPPMPNLNLNRAETEAIIDYLLSLRRDTQ